MRECFTYGSVRGATGDGRPYRDPRLPPSVGTDPEGLSRWPQVVLVVVVRRKRREARHTGDGLLTGIRKNYLQ
jgi:hypothetical protein